jgi:hypothetical protein
MFIFIAVQSIPAEPDQEEPLNKLHVAEKVVFPIEMMTLAMAVLANRGAGKTYFASVLAEELLSAGQQVLILDPMGVMWGLKSGYSIPVFGGDHADVPLQPSSGKALAQAVVEHGFSCILDLSEMENQESLGFVAAFLAELYRKNRQSCYVIIDEADIFAPQNSTRGNGPHALRAMQFLVRRGRVRGLGCALITQRPQAIAKDVLTQCEVLVSLRMSHPRDIAPIDEWIKTQAPVDDANVVKRSLPSLPTGEAWFWAPSLKLFQRAKVRMRRTFDSSATPKPGEARLQPKHLEAVDIAKLGQQIAATVEEQKANDPAALKVKIRELERQLRVPTRASVDDQEVAALRTENMHLHNQATKLANRLSTAQKLAGRLHHLAKVTLVEQLKDLQSSCESMDLQCATILEELNPERDIETAPYPQPRLPAPHAIDTQASVAELNEPKRQILNAVATFENAGVPTRLNAIAGYLGTTKRARGFEENIRQLRNGGFIETQGDLIKMLGPFGTAEEMRGDGALRKVLSEPQYRMLQAVHETPGVSAESLAAWMQTTVRARGFEENLRRLRADELLIGSNDSLQVAEWLC